MQGCQLLCAVGILPADRLHDLFVLEHSFQSSFTAGKVLLAHSPHIFMEIPQLMLQHFA